MTALAVAPHTLAAGAPAPDAVADRPPVRVRRAPAVDPPFDDELPELAAAATAIPGSVMLPLGWPSSGPGSGRPVTPRQPRGPGGGEVKAAHSSGGTLDGQRSPAPLIPARGGPTPARLAARRFLDVCVEVLNGHRPVNHLRAVTVPTDLARVADQLVRRTTRTYLARPGISAPGPHRVRLRSLHTCEPRDGVVELTAVMEYGTQIWAMAARLERRADTWLCTVAQVV